MRRREFITLLGGAAAAWPFAARAQQRERMRRIGVLTSLLADNPQALARNAAFLQGLGELGWNVGRNLQIDYRLGAVDARRRYAYAAELVALALLRPRRERPCRSRAAEERDELASPHSITSSARANRVSGTVSPSAFAVLRLMTSSYFVGACTGRSAGFSPLRMRSTYEAERRTLSAVSGP